MVLRHHAFYIHTRSIQHTSFCPQTPMKNRIHIINCEMLSEFSSVYFKVHFFFLFLFLLGTLSYLIRKISKKSQKFTYSRFLISFIYIRSVTVGPWFIVIIKWHYLSSHTFLCKINEYKNKSKTNNFLML